MASLHKMIYTLWVDEKGRKVPKETPGAKRVKRKSAKWYACWKEGKTQVRVPLATDKSASQAMLADLLRSKDRTAAGLVDPRQHQLNRPITEHMEEYLAAVKAAGKVTNAKYFTEKRRILKGVFSACGMKNLADLQGEAVNRYMTGLTCSAATKRVHHSAVNAFADWLVGLNRLATNPVSGVARPTGGPVIRKRRALKPDQLQRLLDAARERPLASARLNRGGRNARKTKKAYEAELKDQTVARLTSIGRKRALLYKTAIYTGLRKGELAELRVKYLNFDRKPYPYLDLPGEFTKNGEDARLLLVPALAEEIREMVKGRGPNDLVFDVPEQIMPIMRRDLKHAGIAYTDDNGRYADFHSLRKSAGTMLGLAGVPTRIRQMFMRHGDVRLTLDTYDDSDLYDLEEAVRVMEKLGLR